MCYLWYNLAIYEGSVFMTTDKYFDKIGLPEGAVETLKRVYGEVKDTEWFCGYRKKIEEMGSFWEIEADVNERHERGEINKHELFLTIICSSLDIMQKRMADKGLPENVFWDSCNDLVCKANECIGLRGVWGLDLFAIWYQLFFEAKRFALGRLQYEEWPFNQDEYTFDGITIKRDDIIVRLHIPSSGKLLIEDVKESFALAYKTFPKRDGKVFFMCTSWMLFPNFIEIFDKNSNLYKFAELFDPAGVMYHDQFKDAWRIFGTNDTSDTSKLPANSSLQKEFIKYIEETHIYGLGTGVVVCDETGIIN